MNRRQAVSLLSSAMGALALDQFALASSASVPVSSTKPDETRGSFAILTPELTEGPYYIDLERVRRDIIEGKPGVPLRLSFQILQINSGRPVKQAAVDVWHCDAQGVYSGFSGHVFGPGPGRPPPLGAAGGSPPPPPSDQRGLPVPPPGGPRFGRPGPPRIPDNPLTFLRGVQLTDTSGKAEIDTIFPGWYRGRTTHVHVRVHDGGVMEKQRYVHGHVSHTGQIFFPERITDEVYRDPAYARKESGRMDLKDDGIFRQGGSRIAALSLVDPRQPKLGFIAQVNLTIDPLATPLPS